MGEYLDRHILAALVRKLGEDCPHLTADDLDATDPGKLFLMLEPNRGAIFMRYRPGRRGTVRDAGIRAPRPRDGIARDMFDDPTEYTEDSPEHTED